MDSSCKLQFSSLQLRRQSNSATADADDKGVPSFEESKDLPTNEQHFAGIAKVKNVTNSIHFKEENNCGLVDKTRQPTVQMSSSSVNQPR